MIKKFYLHFKDKTDVQLNQSSITGTKDPHNSVSNDESGMIDSSPPAEFHPKQLPVCCYNICFVAFFRNPYPYVLILTIKRCPVNDRQYIFYHKQFNLFSCCYNSRYSKIIQVLFNRGS